MSVQYNSANRKGKVRIHLQVKESAATSFIKGFKNTKQDEIF